MGCSVTMEPQHILIVGSTSGIGEALFNRLQSHDHIRLTTMGRQENPSAHHHIKWDVREDLPNLDELPEEIHGLVYCPGTIVLKPFGRFKKEEWQDDWQVNVLSAAALLQAVYPRLRKGNASVVLFSTVAVQTGMPFHSSIAMAKGALEGLCRSLAAEFAPAIRVNAIAPSLTQTPLADKLLNTPEKKEAASARHPLQRVGTADGVASMAEYLLSPQSAFITGQIFKMDGGYGSIKT
jgi:3-oxoacyl-[acyl-carrier protein] reductase